MQKDAVRCVTEAEASELPRQLSFEQAVQRLTGLLVVDSVLLSPELLTWEHGEDKLARVLSARKEARHVVQIAIAHGAKVIEVPTNVSFIALGVIHDLSLPDDILVIRSQYVELAGTGTPKFQGYALYVPYRETERERWVTLNEA